jgi:hypothetical protein
MNPNPPVYRSYLLRLWKENMQDDWRVLLQEVTTGECRHFSSLADLYEYLRTQADHPTGSDRTSITKLPTLL